jgi:CHAD domain-containing protein
VSAGELVPDLGPLFADLAQSHDESASVLRLALADRRYVELTERIARAAERPLLRDEAEDPAERTLPPLVRSAWKRLRSAGRALDMSAAAEEFHEVRKRAKRARYAAESVAPVLDHGAAAAAERFARRARAVQDVLGQHQDSSVACFEIERIAAAHSGDGRVLLSAGRLVERQAIAATAARKEFFKVWHRLDCKKHVRWMKV